MGTLQHNLRGMLWIIFAVFAVSVVSLCNRFMSMDGLNPSQMIFIRAFFVLLILAPWVIRSRGQLVQVKKPVFYLWRGIFIAISAYGETCSFSYLPLSEANAYLMSSSLMLLPLSQWLLKEQVTWIRWLGMGVGFMGVLLILNVQQMHIQPVALLALLAAFAEAMLGILLKKTSQQDRLSAIIFWSYVAQLLVFGGINHFDFRPMLHPGLLAFGVLTSLCSFSIFYCYFRAYQLAEISLIEIASFTLLLFSAGFGFLFFHEIPPVRFWIGAILMCTGMVIMLIRLHHRPTLQSVESPR